MPIDKLRVMISSRCKDYRLPDGSTFPLSQLRQQLKSEIEAAEFFGHRLLLCFTNEHEPAKAAAGDVWDECMEEVRRAHIVIALYNGDAGWSGTESEDGICHAELATALYSGRSRTFVLQLPLTAKRPSVRDKRFRERFAKELQFTGAPVDTVDGAVKLVEQTLAEALANLARSGALILRKQGYSLGEALDWSRLAFADRKARMEAACLATLREQDGAKPLADGMRVAIPVAGVKILMCVHAIPAATSLSAAREMVGRPFLSDHIHLPRDGELHGPVHLVACHRTATERQATDLLGFPDATVVSGSFGVYVVDPVQRIQMAMLANCRDGTSTRFAVQRFFDWLHRSGQHEVLAEHAMARRRIVRAIQNETGAG